MRVIPAYRRILVIDDDRAIHDDFRKILAPASCASASCATAKLGARGVDLAHEEKRWAANAFELDHAHDGAKGVELVRAAEAQGRPYCMAFVDLREPPGWGGIEIIERIWNEDPRIEIVICTARSDYPWDDIVARLGERSSPLVLQKPFDHVELMQIAHALTEKWLLRREVDANMTRLQDLVGMEMTRREKAKRELCLAQKLEAVGRLASGVAHEMNTPLQYVSDNVTFLRDVFASLMSTLVHYKTMCERLADTIGPDVRAELEQTDQAIDMKFLDENVVCAAESAREGLTRLANIVRALRRYEHPGQDLRPADLNAALVDALEESRHEYRHVADVSTDLGNIVPVSCRVGELNQVFVSLIVNAAHAIRDAGRERGVITASTRLDGDAVVIAIGDNGSGIPVEIRERIFDPFFTTKSVDLGSGQGLAIAWDIVVERHGGTITFESEIGVGTTFYVRIPTGETERREAA